MSTTRKATFGRNDVVAVVRIFQHHSLRCIETYLTEPYSEIGMQALVKVHAQFILRDTECSGKRKHIYIAVLIATIRTPAIKTFLNEVLAFISNYPPYLILLSLVELLFSSSLSNSSSVGI